MGGKNGKWLMDERKEMTTGSEGGLEASEIVIIKVPTF